MYFDLKQTSIESMLAQLPRRTKAEFTCPLCSKLFTRTKRSLWSSLIHKQQNLYCSSSCAKAALVTRINQPCGNCETPVTRYFAECQSSKSGKIFCNRSCSASYHNKNKSYGNRRSKLEHYLEQEIRKSWPDLQLLCNDKGAIGSELDFYFPDLKFAIELNGIFHYEPIYGSEKFNQIQNNDKQKIIQCYQQGIELAVIDSSGCGYLTTAAKNKYFQLIKNLIEPLLQRIS